MKASALEKRRKEQACGTGFHVRLWCNKDPCGLICAVVSWLLVLYAESVVVVRSIMRVHTRRSSALSHIRFRLCRTPGRGDLPVDGAFAAGDREHCRLYSDLFPSARVARQRYSGDRCDCD